MGFPKKQAPDVIDAHAAEGGATQLSGKKAMAKTNPILVDVLSKGEASNRQFRGQRVPTLSETVAKEALTQQDPEDWLRRILTLSNLNAGTAYVVAELLRRIEVAKGVAANKAGV
jgi:hypothetical protein